MDCGGRKQQDEMIRCVCFNYTLRRIVVHGLRITRVVEFKVVGVITYAEEGVYTVSRVSAFCFVAEVHVLK
jgi:hypothetical protein